MRDWNVVATVRGDEFVPAVRFLSRWGRVDRTDFYNVVVLRVEDVRGFLEELKAAVDEEPGTRNLIARVVPFEHTFEFTDRDDFEERARERIRGWTGELAGRAFHVRMHRRGRKSSLSSHEEERVLSDFAFQELEAAGQTARGSFDDPDAILAVETVGGRAGIGLWTREDLARYPFLGLD